MTRKMNGKIIDSWLLHVHREFKYVVTGLSGGYVSGIKVGVDFIFSFSKNSGMIWTLVDVLVDVFDSLD